jgi:pimeloyl-ACP methyl ester carboxylesterase
MGWSNGGFFGQLYAIGRRNTATPGGVRIASAALFAAASPFDDVRWDPFSDVPKAGVSSCRLAKIPSSDVPIMLVYRTCDAAVAVTPAQQSCFDTEPGYVTEPWLAAAAAAGLSYTALCLGGREPGTILDMPAAAATSPICTPTTCSTVTPGCLCLVNHLIWPDGAYRNASSSIDHEVVDMLDFLRAHPLL